MLLHVMTALDESELKGKISKLLMRKDTIVEPVQHPNVFWKGIGGKTSDLLILSRGLFSERAMREVQRLRESADVPAIVVLSDEENDEDRIQLIGAGCEAVLNPKLSPAKLRGALDTILDKLREATVSSLHIPRTPVHAGITDFVAESPAMQQFVKGLPRIAKSDSSVLILGETGVGKERLAHALHAEGRRSEGPFVAVHCSALPESLLESELFGHEQGAFTGAIRSRRGCFELAHLGTIFLDEIGEMPLHLQSKLLRILEDHQIRRVGSEKAVTVDVRIMAATNRDLEEEVKAGRFRSDLYYRLNVVSLTVPPLRERAEDIPELVESYVDYLAPRVGCHVSGINDEALRSLCRYSWPGNVRELINIIERAMLLCEGETITCGELPRSICELSESATDPSAAEHGMFAGRLFEIPLKDAREQILDQFEQAYFARLLHTTKGRLGEAAKKAEVDPRTLFDKMRRYGLDKKDFRPKDRTM